MNILNIDQDVLKIKSNNKFLSLYTVNDIQKLSLILIDGITVSNNVDIDFLSLTNLQKNNIQITVVDNENKANIIGITTSTTKNCFRKYKQYHYFNENVKQILSRKIIELKIQSQLKTLKKLKKLKRCNIQKEIEEIISLENKFKHGLLFEIHNILGYEGIISKLYFKAIAKWLPNSLGFQGRQIRPPKDPFNSLISFYYTLIYQLVVKTINEFGLDSMLGYLHKPCYSRHSLACDIMEPLRAKVDFLIIKLLHNKEIQVANFIYKENACYIGQTAKVKIFKSFNKNKKVFKRYILLHCKSIEKGINNEYPIENNLFDNKEVA